MKVTFLNKIDRALSIHPHGVFYTKANEGALYNDGTSGAPQSGLRLLSPWSKKGMEHSACDGDKACLSQALMHAGADKLDDSVRKGQTYTYTWEVRGRSAPGPKDPSSVVWMYHSHHSEVQDTNTGLYGAMIISAKVAPPLHGLLQQADRVAEQGQHSRAV